MKRVFIGLADDGARIHEVYEPGIRGMEQGIIMTIAYNADGSMTVLDTREWADSEELESARRREDQERFWIDHMGNATGIATIASNQGMLFADLTTLETNVQMGAVTHKSPAIQNLPNRPLNLMVWDEFTNIPVLKLKKKSPGTPPGTSYRATAVKHPHRKPQPNRGPVGKRKWQ